MNAYLKPESRARRVYPPAAHAIAAVTLGVLLPALWPSAAAAMNRCEGRDGHVTYTDEACPPNTRLARRVDITPPVIALDPRAPKAAEGSAPRDDPRSAATRDGKETRESKEAKDPKEPRDEARAAARETATERPAAAAAPAEPPRIDSGGRIQPTMPAPLANPEQEIQRLDELRLRQERQCSDLNRRIQFTRADLATASGADRASIELLLRRLQEDARTVCP
jgi:hypothetical protein